MKIIDKTIDFIRKSHNLNNVGVDATFDSNKQKHTNKLMSNTAITLIALIITIIILLILAGITLSMVMGESGIFNKANIAKEQTQYKSAKEVIQIKLLDISAKCVQERKEFKIEEIAKEMKKTENIMIEKYYNSETALIKSGVTENLVNLEAIVVSVNEYKQYKFLIGKEGEITGVKIGEVTEETKIEEFKNIKEFEKDLIVADKEKETKIVIDKNNITIEQGNTETIQATLINITGKTLFESSDPNVATVDNNGIITAIDEGETTITVKVEGTNYKTTCKVIVTIPVKLTGLVVEDIEVAVGQPKKLKVIPQPNGAKLCELIYNPVTNFDCSIDQDGYVTVLSRGIGRIEIRAKNDSSISTSCAIVATNSITEIEIGKEAFDQDANSYFEIKPTQNYEFLIAKLPINSSDYGKNININLETRYGSGPDQNNTIYFYDIEGKRIQNIGANYSVAGGGTHGEILSYVIPENCAYIQFEVRNCSYGTWMRLKEITIKE